MKSQFTVREISSGELAEFQKLHFKRIFANRLEASGQFEISNEDRGLIHERGEYQQKAEDLRLGVFAGEKLIGWHYGFTFNAETFYMQNSAILEEYRGQGAYQVLLEEVLKKVKARGYQVVLSLHHPNNPAVLIPKLKKGFVISGVQFHERFKFVVELRYFFDPARRKAFGISMGLDL